MTTTTNWEKEYDETFSDNNEVMYYENEVKAFIRTLLAKQRQELLDQVKSVVESCSLDLVACSDYAPPFRKDYTDKWKLLEKLSALRLSVKNKK